MSQWTLAYNARGPAGAGFIAGSGAPSSSIGNVGDSYFDTTTSGAPIYYAPKTTNGWGSGVALKGVAGAAGLSVLTGSGAPGSTAGTQGQAYVDTTNGVLYTYGTSGWNSGVSLIGAAGATILTGSGAPASTTGNVGDVYFDTTSTGAPIFYGKKTSSGWASSGVSLLGQTGQTGAAGSQITYGTAVPGPPYTGHNNGDMYLRTTTGDLYQLQAGSGWTFVVNLQGAIGPSGLSVLSGSGAPSSSLGSQGQVYIDTAAGNLYVKGSSSWTLSLSLVGQTGAQGASIQTGTGAPSSSLGSVGDIYVDLTSGAVTLYGKKTSSGWPSTGTILTGSQGQQGTAGLSVLSGSGAPASSLGVQNQPAYIDTAAGNLYGAKGASAWPTSFLSLIGSQGLSVLSGSGAPASSLGVSGQPGYIDTTNGILYGAKTSTWPTGISLNGASIRNGTGAPTSSNPTVQFDGDFYVDTQNNLIYGPRASGAWPSSGIAFAGSSNRFGSGPPSASIGALNDNYFDLTNALFYPQKTSSGWTNTPINMVGPTGVGTTSSLRNVAKGFVALTSANYATANANVAVNTALVTGTAASVTPLVEPMIAAGSIVGVAVSCPGSTTACNGTVNVLKNGTSVFTASSVIACNSTATTTTGSAKPASTVSFASGDVLTMTASFSATGAQIINVTLYYLTNS